MDHKKVAAEVISLLGGKENIANAFHCVTRLRFYLNDESLADMRRIREIEGVKGTLIKNEQYQVVIGTMVGDVFVEVEALLG